MSSCALAAGTLFVVGATRLPFFHEQRVGLFLASSISETAWASICALPKPPLFIYLLQCFPVDWPSVPLMIKSRKQIQLNSSLQEECFTAGRV